MSTLRATSFDCHLAPLVIGCAGHDDFDESLRDQLEKAVAQFFQWLQRQYPHTPLLLLTTLQTKADRLAAAAALKRGLQLIVASPGEAHPLANCREHSELLGKACVVHEISSSRLERNGERRAHAAAFVAKHSQLFLALWDGVEKRDPPAGDVAQLAQFRRTGVPASLQPASEPLLLGGAAGFYQIEVPRRERSNKRKLSRFRAVGIHAKDLLSHRSIDRFNRDARRLLSDRGPELLQKPIDGFKDPLLLAPPAAADVWRKHVLADQLAMQDQTHGRWVKRGLFVLRQAWDCVADLRHVGDYLGDGITWLKTLRIIGGLPWGAGSRHAEYRALAEALRIQCYWRLLSIDELVVDRYAEVEREELDWIPQTLWIWDFLARHGRESVPDGPKGAHAATHEFLDEVWHGWIEGQRDFFRGTVTGDERSQVKWRLGQLVVGALLVWSLAAIVVPRFALKDSSFYGPGQVLVSFGLVSQSSTGALGSIHIVTSAVCMFLQAFFRKAVRLESLRKDDRRRYKRMLAIYTDAAADLARSRDPAVVRRLAMEVGSNAIKENLSWFKGRRDASDRPDA